MHSRTGRKKYPCVCSNALFGQRSWGGGLHVAAGPCTLIRGGRGAGRRVSADGGTGRLQGPPIILAQGHLCPPGILPLGCRPPSRQVSRRVGCRSGCRQRLGRAVAEGRRTRGGWALHAAQRAFSWLVAYLGQAAAGPAAKVCMAVSEATRLLGALGGRGSATPIRDNGFVYVIYLTSSSQLRTQPRSAGSTVCQMTRALASTQYACGVRQGGMGSLCLSAREKAF